MENHDIQGGAKHSYSKPHKYEVVINANGRIVKLTVKGHTKNMERRYGALWDGV